MMKGHCEMKCICTTRQDWRLRWNSLNYQKVTSINIYRQSCLSIDVAQYGSLYSLPVPLPCILTMTDCWLISQVAPSPIQDKTYHWRKWTIGGPEQLSAGLCLTMYLDLPTCPSSLFVVTWGASQPLKLLDLSIWSQGHETCSFHLQFDITHFWGALESSHVTQYNLTWPSDQISRSILPPGHIMAFYKNQTISIDIARQYEELELGDNHLIKLAAWLS